jgi:hypothetical protein
MGLDQGLSFGHEEFSVVVKDSVQSFENVGRGQVEFV